jgi:uncharacterized protein YukE
MSNGSELHDLQVKFQELQNAASAYKAEGDDVKKALAAFEQAANLPASAFGNLAQSGNLASEYERFYNQVVSDVAKLAKTLPEGGAKLAASAIVYHNAEVKLAQRIAEIAKLDKTP